MSTLFEKLLNLQSSLILRYAEAHSYADSWGKDFVFKYVKESPTGFAGFKFDPNQLSLQEMKKLGFRTWDESGLRLIPLWLFSFIQPGSVIVSISGETLKFSPYEEDTDHRFGMLAFGVIAKDEPPADPLPCDAEGYDEAAEKL